MGPSVPGLSNSARKITTVPSAINASEPHTVRAVCMDHSGRLRPRSASSSCSTGNPRPPMMIASISGASTSTSDENRTTLSAQVEKPALLKADMEWNMPCQAASPQGMP
ncbi:hypothetical protein D3C72_1579240 [compost metagenome]